MSTDNESGERLTPGQQGFGPSDGVLVANDLRKEFGGLTAVDDLSFAVQEQEILGFIGPNGAGKSTTFNCVTGFYGPTGGNVWFKGEDVTGLESLAPDELLTLAGVSGETERLAEEICRRVGLGDQLEETPGELPHAGMLKLEIAKAIATNPDLMLVDEPFAGLSSGEVQELTEVLLSLRDNGMTLIVVDHNMRGLLNLIDRAFVIQFGAKIAEGPPDEITDDPKVQEAYLGGDEI